MLMEDLLYLFGMTNSFFQAFHLVVKVSPDRYPFRGSDRSRREEIGPALTPSGVLEAVAPPTESLVSRFEKQGVKEECGSKVPLEG